VALVADEQDVIPLDGERRASLCTLVTSGQVASMVCRLRALASARTCGATPCAEKTTTAPSGTSAASSTNTAPRFSSDATTCLLWTICLRT
jgi:BRCT domain type II-containing protein